MIPCSQMPDCPHCKQPLTEAQIKSLWASVTQAKRVTKSGGKNAPGWPKGKPRKAKEEPAK